MISQRQARRQLVNNPALKSAGIDARKLGRRAALADPDHARRCSSRAAARCASIDKKTGRFMNEMPLGGSRTGGPMTYMVNGRQFIVVTVGGGQNGHEFVALTLPPPRGAAPAKAKPGAAKPKPAAN